MTLTTEKLRTESQISASSLATIAHYLRPQAGKATLMALLLLAGIGLQLWIPQILRLFIDGAMEGVATSQLQRMALWFLGIALGHQLLAAIATYVAADVGWAATNQLRGELAGHVLSLDMSFHTSKTPGEMIERIDGDITALSNFFSQFSVRVFGGLLLLLGILILLWIENPWVGLALTIFTLLELAVLAWTRKVGVPASAAEREVNAMLFGFIEERLGGIEDLRANGAGAHSMHRFGAVMRDFYRGTRRAWMMRSLVWLTSYGLFVASSAVLLASAIILVSNGRASLGTGYMIFQYLLMLQTPIDQITQQMQELQKAAASTGRVRDLFGIERAREPRHGVRLPAGPLQVEFGNVSFGYQATSENETPAATLHGVSFSLPPGKVVGILGRTGSGKTTMTRLLFRLYRPTSGVVRIGGVDIAEADQESLRDRVGLVTQEVQLFQASVRDNLTFFRRDRSDVELVELLSDLGLGRWYRSLPQGLDTRLTAGGGNLSAGEAQLLAFARVFLKDPGLVVLDEPSSRLDPATEQQLELLVDRLLENRSGLLIAHRLETVQRADYILVLGEGRVLEFGPRAQLADRPDSHYSRMLRASRVAPAPDERPGSAPRGSLPATERGQGV